MKVGLSLACDVHHASNQTTHAAGLFHCEAQSTSMGTHILYPTSADSTASASHFPSRFLSRSHMQCDFLRASLQDGPQWPLDSHTLLCRIRAGLCDRPIECCGSDSGWPPTAGHKGHHGPWFSVSPKASTSFPAVEEIHFGVDPPGPESPATSREPEPEVASGLLPNSSYTEPWEPTKVLTVVLSHEALGVIWHAVKDNLYSRAGLSLVGRSCCLQRNPLSIFILPVD